MYRYEFKDGYVIVSNLNSNELAWEKVRHGKLVSKTPA